jgi:hypothetical protein
VDRAAVFAFELLAHPAMAVTERASAQTNETESRDGVCMVPT